MKTSWRYLCNTPWRYLEDVLKTILQDVLKMFPRRLEDALKTSWICLEDVWILVLMKTSSEDVWVRRIYLSWLRRLVDVLNTSSEDKDERRLQDVFIKMNICCLTSFLVALIVNNYLLLCLVFFKKEKNRACCVLMFYSTEFFFKVKI